jgi:hypothetical protein
MPFLGVPVVEDPVPIKMFENAPYIFSVDEQGSLRNALALGDSP